MGGACQQMLETGAIAMVQSFEHWKSVLFFVGWRMKIDFGYALPETNSLHLKMDGWTWNTSFLLGLGLFSGSMLVSRSVTPHPGCWLVTTRKTWDFSSQLASCWGGVDPSNNPLFGYKGLFQSHIIYIFFLGGGNPKISEFQRFDFVYSFPGCQKLKYHRHEKNLTRRARQLSWNAKKDHEFRFQMQTSCDFFRQIFEKIYTNLKKATNIIMLIVFVWITKMILIQIIDFHSLAIALFVWCSERILNLIFAFLMFGCFCWFSNPKKAFH